MRAMWVITMLDDCVSFEASDTLWQQASSAAALLVPFSLVGCFTQLGKLSSTHTRSDKSYVRRREVDHQQDIPWCAPCTVAVTVTGTAKATVHSQFGTRGCHHQQPCALLAVSVHVAPAGCMMALFWMYDGSLLDVAWLLLDV
jgi:hypothetical protein